MTCPQQIALGAYVVDALDPVEAGAVRAHLDGCAGCTEALAGLAGLPALLRRVPYDDAVRLAPEPPGPGPAAEPVDPVLLERLLTAARAERRTRRRRRAVLAAAAAMVVAATTGVTVRSLDEPPDSPVVRAVDPTTQVNAEVTLTGRGEGTELSLRLRGVDPGEHCSLVARARDGRTEIAATWVATYTGTADVPGSTAIPADQLQELDVITTDGRLLVRLPVG